VAVSGKYGDWSPPEFPDRVERTQVITNPGPDSVADTLAGPRPVIIRVPPWRDPGSRARRLALSKIRAERPTRRSGRDARLESGVATPPGSE
jgi:hypothetical protein